MVRQLEKEGEQVAFLSLIDSVPPRAYAIEDLDEWAVEPPFHRLQEYFDQKIDGIKEIEKIIPSRILHSIRSIPDVDRWTVRDLVAYLKMNRALTVISASYVPLEKVVTTIHYFAAGGSRAEHGNGWNNYSSGPIKFYQAPGDHYSIFRLPGIIGFAELFAGVIPNPEMLPSSY
jgi:thioesterase domain-containing protein